MATPITQSSVAGILKELYDEQGMRLTEVEVQLEQHRAQLAVLKTLPNGQNVARNR
jgi:hypothetical protein